MNNIKTDIAIVGGGPAGLGAALEAKKAGVKDIVILERKEQLGGLLDQCIHNGFGLHYFNDDLTGPEYAWKFLDEINNSQNNSNVKVYLETMVTEITPDKQISAISNKNGVLNIDAGAIILAMGCRERSRGQINIPGSRPAGIYTAGTAQRFINIEDAFPGKEVVILGSGDIGMIMARRLTLEGANVKAVAEILPYIGGLVRNEVQCLRDFNIPIYLERTVSHVYGNKRVEGVDIAKVDENLNPIPGTEKRIDCDTLLLSVGLIPENEISKTAGIKLSSVGGPEVDENMHTNIPGIFAAGNAVHVHDLVDYVTLTAEQAGKAAACYVFDELEESKRKIAVDDGDNINYVIPQYISEDEDVSLYMRVNKPARKAMIKIGDIKEKKENKIRPSEMIKIDIGKEEIAAYKGQEIKVNCEIIETKEEENESKQEGEEIICLVCPLACRGKVIHDNGKIKDISGYKCKKGEEYAKKEIKLPERVLPTTVKTEHPEHSLLSVRTDKPVPKELLMDCMEKLKEIKIKKDQKFDIGDTVVPNILNTGANVISTAKYPQKFV